MTEGPGLLVQRGVLTAVTGLFPAYLCSHAVDVADPIDTSQPGKEW